jgi:hypothetical protein
MQTVRMLALRTPSLRPLLYEALHELRLESLFRKITLQ